MQRAASHGAGAGTPWPPARWVDKGCCRGAWKTAVPGAGTPFLPRRMRGDRGGGGNGSGGPPGHRAVLLLCWLLLGPLGSRLTRHAMGQSPCSPACSGTATCCGDGTCDGCTNGL